MLELSIGGWLKKSTIARACGGLEASQVAE